MKTERGSTLSVFGDLPVISAGRAETEHFLRGMLPGNNKLLIFTGIKPSLQRHKPNEKNGIISGYFVDDLRRPHCPGKELPF